MDKYENWLAKIRDNYLEEMLENWAEYWALFWSPSEVMNEIENLLKIYKKNKKEELKLKLNKMIYYICKECWFVEEHEYLSDWTCARCWNKVLKIWWKYADTILKLETKVRLCNSEKERVNDLLDIAVKELQFSNIQRDSYKNILEEVKELLKKWVSKKIISKVIDNGITRCILDTTIHNDLLFKNKLWEK